MARAHYSSSPTHIASCCCCCCYGCFCCCSVPILIGFWARLRRRRSRWRAASRARLAISGEDLRVASARSSRLDLRSRPQAPVSLLPLIPARTRARTFAASENENSSAPITGLDWHHLPAPPLLCAPSPPLLEAQVSKNERRRGRRKRTPIDCAT